MKHLFSLQHIYLMIDSPFKLILTHMSDNFILKGEKTFTNGLMLSRQEAKSHPMHACFILEMQNRYVNY